MSYEYDFYGNRYRSAYNYQGQTLKRATPAELDEIGEELLTDAKSRIAELTSGKNCLVFGFISDTHRCSTTYDGKAISDTHSINLLSRLCDEIHLDCVFHGGDMASARDHETNASIQQHQYDVVNELDEKLPYTNIFATVGNHDKKYDDSFALKSTAYFYELFDTIQYNGNDVELNYIDDTNYYIDFPKRKVRIIVADQYDALTDSEIALATHCTWSWTSALNFDAPQRASEWLVGVVFHGMAFTGIKDIMEAYKNGTSAEHYTNTNGEAGRGYLGSFVGHLHGYAINSAWEVPKYANGINSIWTTSAYANPEQIGTADAYGFSVFVIDVDSGEIRQIQIGREANIALLRAMFAADNPADIFRAGVAFNISYRMAITNNEHIRFEQMPHKYMSGINFTNLESMNTYDANDYVSNDTANTLFHLTAGDVLKTVIRFTEKTEYTNGRSFRIFSPQINNMVSGTVKAGEVYEKSITIDTDTDITAIGMYYAGSTAETEWKTVDFDIELYVNGERITQRT